MTLARMWEARAAAGRLAAAGRALAEAAAALRAAPGCLGAEAYASTADDPDARLVLVTRWADERALAGADPDEALAALAGLLARPGHGWTFAVVG